MQNDNITCLTLMQEFADRTGLLDDGIPPRRYLWTDAFAVCNFLELYRQCGDRDCLQLALKLVDQVHEVLGKQRPDSGKQGWLSGLEEETARQHPTCAGLRIGKPLDERQPGEAPDEAREWQQDGQYFHYLTRWMHALDCVARVTHEARYLQWAIELAQAAHAAFTWGPAGTGSRKRMYWKMSIDLSRPLVPSMGQHDPLDGLLTCLKLAASAKSFNDEFSLPVLQHEISDMAAMCRDMQWATRDALGIGGLLVDANRLLHLTLTGAITENPTAADLLQNIEISLHTYQQQHPLRDPAEHRLAFRELGLAIGLRALPLMEELLDRHKGQFDNAEHLQGMLDRLMHFYSLQQGIENFWLEPQHRKSRTWQEHADINTVMLATCLEPATYLGQ